MLANIQHFWQLWRYFGPGWLAYRLGYAARLRLGVLRRQLPITVWEAYPLDKMLNDPALSEPAAYFAYRRTAAPSFFFSEADRPRFRSHFAGWDKAGSTAIQIADDIFRGTWRYFEHNPGQPGLPPDWHANPFTNQRAPANCHWSRLDDFDYGDIKVIWEASRFGFVYALVRAYWRTGDERYAELFWQLVEDWRTHNPPQQSVNWKCGQEISFRVMAWCFGLYGFLEAKATTAQRVTALAQMIAVSGRRIEVNLDYALSQRNNHGISEGVGLWTIGTLFPELRQAVKWRKVGRQILESLGRDLIYSDGSFVQHSVNYHRLMLHDYLWALRLADLHGQPFSMELRERVERAGIFLYQLQDAQSGQLPYYGQNDGALILPLNNCDYRQFRPVIQAVHFFFNGTRCYGDGPWDEDLLWLFGPEAPQAPVKTPERVDLNAETGGYYTLRSTAGFVFTRCATFQHRPGQADMLHLDLWWRGQNIALDAGTYSYNVPPPWRNPLAQTAYHNTVTIDNLDQMERASKFLWLPWLRSRVHVRRQSAEGHLAYFEGEHDGYQRLDYPARHRRGILRLGQEHWLVLDGLSSQVEHQYRLHWLFPDLPYTWNEQANHLTLHTPAGLYHMQAAVLAGGGLSSLVRADEHSPRGWQAPYYNYRKPALSVALITQATSLTFWTLFGPESSRVGWDGTTLQVDTGQWQALLRLSMDSQQTLLTSAVVTGLLTDELEVL